MDIRDMAHGRLLARTFEFWTGEKLLESVRKVPTGVYCRQLFDAPFALVAHGTEADPVFCYANRTALDLWEMSWEEFTILPSRQSAPRDSDTQDDRQKLLAEALKNGCVNNYRGVRVSKTGRLFEISDTVLWNVTHSGLPSQGQAALIRKWRFL